MKLVVDTTMSVRITKLTYFALSEPRIVERVENLAK